MINPIPPPADPPRPWYRTAWGMAYLALLGCTSGAMLLIALMMPVGQGEKFVALIIPSCILDGLLAIGIAVAIFRRPFWRVSTVPIVDWIVGLVLFLPCIYLVCSLVFVACMLLGSFG